MSAQIGIIDYDFGGKVDRIGNEIILMENPYFENGYEYPFSSECTQCVVILAGTMRCTLDVQEYEISSKGLLFILPGRIVQRISFDSGFKGYFIVMSSDFTNGLGLNNEYELFQNITSEAYTSMVDEAVNALVVYIQMLQGIMRQEDNPNRLNIARHLTIAYNLGLGYYIHKNTESTDASSSSSYELTIRKFLKMVRDNCRLRRDMEFYAGELCISPKHLTTVVKSVTGRSAMKWIEEYTVLNAKMLLKTTNMTVGQVSDELNFSAQSDFGKYFKRLAGISPRKFKSGE